MTYSRRALAGVAAGSRPLLTEPDLEPDPELHLRGRSRRYLAANVKAYCEEAGWVCHTCGHSYRNA